MKVTLDGVASGELPDHPMLRQLHAMAPRQARYALGARPGEGRTAKGWNVILPLDIMERRFEGL